MQIPLDFSTLSLWFAASSIMLLITTELAAAYDGKATLFIDQKKLGTAAIIAGILFLVTVAIRYYEIVNST